ncbi:uncharacterized protein [Procambarus clarkii]|uniref:uncharacterized protein n=1 Tax=Procambarus clarkii TaxID=6728 RepID=UPI001E673A0C|nr:uncharacterized protein LOC123768863 [Procambarus clarkii]
MARMTPVVLAFSCCLLVFVLLPATPAQAQGAYRVPRHRNRWWAQPRSLWSQARSMMPRLYTVASDAVSVLVLPALAVLAISGLWPERHHYQIKREADETEKVEVGGMTEYLLGVYQKAIESDLCIQRLACKLGAASTSLKPHHQKLVLRLLGYVTSSRYSNLFTKFKAGVNEEKCETFECSVIDKK